MFDAIIPACLEWEGAESLRTDTIRGAHTYIQDSRRSSNNSPKIHETMYLRVTFHTIQIADIRSNYSMYVCMYVYVYIYIYIYIYKYIFLKRRFSDKIACVQKRLRRFQRTKVESMHTFGTNSAW
jgi:hypothetical protein